MRDPHHFPEDYDWNEDMTDAPFPMGWRDHITIGLAVVAVLGGVWLIVRMAL